MRRFADDELRQTFFPLAVQLYFASDPSFRHYVTAAVQLVQLSHPLRVHCDMRAGGSRGERLRVLH